MECREDTIGGKGKLDEERGSHCDSRFSDTIPDQPFSPPFQTSSSSWYPLSEWKVSFTASCVALMVALVAIYLSALYPSRKRAKLKVAVHRRSQVDGL